MSVHVALLAVPAVAGGFLQAFQFAFLLWPFNLALPLARHLPLACAALRGVASCFYDAELRRGARRAMQLLPAPARRLSQQYASLRSVIALVDISY